VVESDVRAEGCEVWETKVPPGSPVCSTTCPAANSSSCRLWAAPTEESAASLGSAAPTTAAGAAPEPEEPPRPLAAPTWAAAVPRLMPRLAPPVLPPLPADVEAEVPLARPRPAPPCTGRGANGDLRLATAATGALPPRGVAAGEPLADLPPADPPRDLLVAEAPVDAPVTDPPVRCAARSAARSASDPGTPLAVVVARGVLSLDVPACAVVPRGVVGVTAPRRRPVPDPCVSEAAELEDAPVAGATALRDEAGAARRPFEAALPAPRGGPIMMAASPVRDPRLAPPP